MTHPALVLIGSAFFNAEPIWRGWLLTAPAFFHGGLIFFALNRGVFFLTPFTTLLYAVSGRPPTRVGGPFITSDHQLALLSLDTSSAPGLRANPSELSTAALTAAR